MSGLEIAILIVVLGFVLIAISPRRDANKHLHHDRHHAWFMDSDTDGGSWGDFGDAGGCDGD